METPTALVQVTTPDPSHAGLVPVMLAQEPTSLSLSAGKADIDVAQATSPHGGSTIMWAIGALAIILIVLFIVVMIAFFVWAGRNPPTHNIEVTNDASVPVSVIFGADNGNGVSAFDPITLQPGDSKTYTATPGAGLQIAGLLSEQTSGVTEAAFTFTVLQLAGSNYDGVVRISNGPQIIENLERFTNNQDLYGVSMQRGYNLQMTIRPTQNVEPNLSDPFSCTSPQWFHTVNSSTSVPQLHCPPELQDEGACASACDTFSGVTGTVYCCAQEGACSVAGGCENEWPNYDYYTVFYNACQNCLITNCDTLNYHCTSEANTLSNYHITFTN